VEIRGLNLDVRADVLLRKKGKNSDNKNREQLRLNADDSRFVSAGGDGAGTKAYSDTRNGHALPLDIGT